MAHTTYRAKGTPRMDLLLGLLSGDALFDLLAEFLRSEVTKMTIAFIIASKLHERTVKKENALMRASIDHVAAVMGKRLDLVDQEIEKIKEQIKGEL